eukprot:849995_1
MYTAHKASKDLPNADDRFAVGYNSADNEIFYVGGWQHRSQLVTFDPANETFTVHQRYYHKQGYSISDSPPFWTQIDNTLWIIMKGDIPDFNANGECTGTKVAGVGFMTLDTQTYEL